MVGGTIRERLPIWYGIGGNGKTTTARVLEQAPRPGRLAADLAKHLAD